ncbi:hypothetical protein CCAL9344_01275 [Campylobacter sp. RM9344]|uniref:Uncharacterized protein n=1 Tax=Campylobacter californiensis TaxID=1032243 RepID=A0AAW3ZVG1_9BACT|nr:MULTISPECIES: hypothetical protein [unclassified Campylobacter]MBE2984647.1 hypothetical protein [Campylobacter sp. RM6883]MBE2994563.1 hypothetical protein [Campylobacter sp. RM6913]MBE3028830.1 hypothetical protein [Campylobacter sp. RM9344]MBE3607188.1 hypothetical protein [Campylobacter sp. RM9337]MBE3609512.1 hypothetical protein [Campylobacter sp. RM12916]
MENSLNFSDEIKETTGLITSAGSWGSNEFLVFMVIFGFVAFVIIFWLLSKNANANSQKIIEVTTKTNEAFNNNADATRALIETLKIDRVESRQKLNDIHEDVKEIKFNVKRKNKNFGEHIKESEYEDGIY